MKNKEDYYGKVYIGNVYTKVDKSNPYYPMSSNGCISEHRLVMATILGRCLLPTEIVHHKNGLPYDNKPENLVLFQSNGEHTSFHRLLRTCGIKLSTINLQHVKIKS